MNGHDGHNQLRALLANINQNIDFRQGILNGSIEVSQLVSMKDGDMARKELKAEREQQHEKDIKERIITGLASVKLTSKTKGGTKEIEPGKVEGDASSNLDDEVGTHSHFTLNSHS
jgi:hypothetical protein